jgi:hypothetical protein
MTRGECIHCIFLRFLIVPVLDNQQSISEEQGHPGQHVYIHMYIYIYMYIYIHIHIVYIYMYIYSILDTLSSNKLSSYLFADLVKEPYSAHKE